MGNFGGSDIVTVDEPDRLHRIRRDHFEICISTFEIIKTVREKYREGPFVEIEHDFDSIHNHFGLGKDSIRWFAPEEASEILPNY